jgi:hypothetical protein
MQRPLIGRVTGEPPCLAVTVALHVVSARGFRSSTRRRTAAMIQRSGRFGERDGASVTATLLIGAVVSARVSNTAIEHGNRTRQPNTANEAAIVGRNNHTKQL